MTTEVERDIKAFGKLPASGGVILRGPYGDLLEWLDEIERTAPATCRILYKTFAPGGLRIVVGEG